MLVDIVCYRGPLWIGGGGRGGRKGYNGCFGGTLHSTFSHYPGNFLVFYFPSMVQTLSSYCYYSYLEQMGPSAYTM